MPEDQTAAVGSGDGESTVRAHVRDIIRELRPAEAVADKSRPIVEIMGDVHLVNDLGFHSLALLEIAFALEEDFDLEPLDEKEAKKLSTVVSIENYVVEQLRARNDDRLR